MSKDKTPAPAHPEFDRQMHSSTDNLLHKDEVRSQTYTEPDVDRPSGRPAAHAETSGFKRFSKMQGAKFGNFGFGKQAQKSETQKGLVITRPMETLPSEFRLGECDLAVADVSLRVCTGCCFQVLGGG